MTPAGIETLNIYCRSCLEWAMVGRQDRVEYFAYLIFG